MDNNYIASLLATLYSSNDNASIQDASRKLNDWQQTPEAWTQTHALLSTPGLQSELYYFFAQTLKSKIQYDMYQLPVGSYLSLRDSLVDRVLSVSNNSVAKATRKQLCLAIADLSIQAIEVWPTSIPDLVNLLQQDHVTTLLEILKLIPEETENLKLLTESGKRNKSRHQCLEFYYSVFELLNQKFDSVDKGDVLDCFIAWLKFDSPPIQYSLSDSPIFNYCLSRIGNLNASNLALEDNVVEVLTEVVRHNSSYRGGHSGFIETVIFPRIAQLVQLLLVTNIEDILESDFEGTKSICRLLVLTGEGMLEVCVDDHQRVGQFMSLMIKLIRVHNIDITELVVPFWEEYLSAANSKGIPSVVQDALFNALIERCDIATESSYNINADPFTCIDSDFFYLRNSELLKLLYTLSRDFIGRAAALEKLLTGCVNAAGSSLTLSEALLVCVKDQLGNLSDPPESLINAVGLLIVTLPSWVGIDSIHTCKPIEAFHRRTVLGLVGKLGSWVRTEPEALALVDLAAQVLIRPSVIHRSLHVAASISFKELCFNSHFRRFLTPGPIQAICNLFTHTIGHLPSKEHGLVTEGITTLLSHQDNDQIFASVMTDVILSPLLVGLSKATDALHAGTLVDRLTCVVRYTEKLRHGTVRYSCLSELLVNSLWPVLSASMDKYKCESDFIEKACRLLKHSIRACPSVFVNCLIPIGHVLVRDFPLVQHSSYLYTAEVLVQEFGQDPAAGPALMELFDSLVRAGTHILESRLSGVHTSSFGEENVDELIEDLYGMMERFLRFAPSCFLKAKSVPQALGQLVPVIAHIKRSETIEAVSAFVEQVYAGEWTHSADISSCAVSNTEVVAIRQTLSQLAPMLVDQLFRTIVSVCGRAMRQAIPSMLMTINQFDPETYQKVWLVHSVGVIPISIMTERDKTEALVALANSTEERTVANCVNEMIYRAELVDRRLRNEAAK